MKHSGNQAKRGRTGRAARSDLEFALLGTIHCYGPCTAYRVRRVFAESLSAHWSGSAGAVYPALRRLEAAGLVRSKCELQGKRSRSLYALTRAGRTALTRWLRPPLPAPESLMGFDPLRLRVRFLSALPVAERAAFLADAIAALRVQTARISSALDDAGTANDPWITAVHRGALRCVQAQIAWLTELQQHRPARPGHRTGSASDRAVH